MPTKSDKVASSKKSATKAQVHSAKAYKNENVSMDLKKTTNTNMLVKQDNEKMVTPSSSSPVFTQQFGISDNFDLEFKMAESSKATIRDMVKKKLFYHYKFCHDYAELEDYMSPHSVGNVMLRLLNVPPDFHAGFWCSAKNQVGALLGSERTQLTTKVKTKFIGKFYAMLETIGLSSLIAHILLFSISQPI